MKKFLLQIGAFVSALTIFPACQKVNELADQFKNHGKKEEGIVFYTLAGNKLFKYSTAQPDRLLNSSTVTGMLTGERILGIDFRPATGQLYALGSSSRLYTIDFSSGNASLVAALTTIPTGSTTAVPLSLSGSSFGFDFNPVVDRIRIVSNSGQNLRAHPVTGVTIVDGVVNPQSASVNAVAYDNNDTDTTTGTELFALDAVADKFFEIDPPNNGTLINPLPLGIDISGDGGFDIAPRNNKVTTDVALAVFEVNKTSTLFEIDLATGKARVLAKYHKDVYTGIAIASGQ